LQICDSEKQNLMNKLCGVTTMYVNLDTGGYAEYTEMTSTGRDHTSTWDDMVYLGEGARAKN